MFGYSSLNRQVDLTRTDLAKSAISGRWFPRVAVLTLLLLHPHQPPRKLPRLEGPEIPRLLPTPTKCTGSPNSCASATATPPFALPSSFLTASPVTATLSLNTLQCRTASCPILASSLSSTERGASGPSRFSAQMILPCAVARLPRSNRGQPGSFARLRHSLGNTPKAALNLRPKWVMSENPQP